MTGESGRLFGRAGPRRLRPRRLAHLGQHLRHRQQAGRLSLRWPRRRTCVVAGLPAETYGFWVDRGATMIQTDEPTAAIEWLGKRTASVCPMAALGRRTRRWQRATEREVLSTPVNALQDRAVAIEDGRVFVDDFLFHNVVERNARKLKIVAR